MTPIIFVGSLFWRLFSLIGVYKRTNVLEVGHIEGQAFFCERQESDNFCFRGWGLYSEMSSPSGHLAPHCPRAPCPPSCCLVRPQKVELYLASTEYLPSIYTVDIYPVSTARCSGLQCAETSQGGSSAAVLLDTGALTNIITQAGGTGRHDCPQI